MLESAGAPLAALVFGLLPSLCALNSRPPARPATGLPIPREKLAHLANLSTYTLLPMLRTLKQAALLQILSPYRLCLHIARLAFWLQQQSAMDGSFIETKSKSRQ